MDVVTLAAEFPNDNPALHRGVIWVCAELLGAPVAEPHADARAEQSRIELVALTTEQPDQAIEEILAEAPAPRPSGIIMIQEELTFSIEDEVEVVIEELEPMLEAVVEGSTPAPALESARSSERVEPSAVAAVEEAAANDLSPTTTSLPPPPDDPFTVLLCTLADVAVAAGSPHVAAILPKLLLEGRLDEPLPDDASRALAEAGMIDDGAATDVFVKVITAWREILRGTSDDFDATGGAMLDEWAAELLARLLGAPGRAPTLRRDLRARGVAAFGMAA